MNLKRCVAFCFGLIPACHGQVFLSLSDGDASPTTGFVAPGGSLSLMTTLQVTGTSQVTGVDYYLESFAAASGLFRIQAANRSSSPFNDVYFSDTVVSTSPGSILDPRNNSDLGASLDNISSPVGAGEYDLGIFTLSVDSLAAPGTYFISTVSQAGTGWVDASFKDNLFSGHAAFTLTVVPEPATASTAIACGLAGLAAFQLVARRRQTGVVDCGKL
jgi:hypothetical protein